MNIDDSLAKYCQYAALIRGLSPETIKRHRGTVRILQHMMGVSTLQECTSELIQEFFHRGRLERNWSPGTFEAFKVALSKYFRWCVAQSWMDEDPAAGLERPKKSRRIPHRLTKQEALRVLEAVRNYPLWPEFTRARNHAVFATLIFSGLRSAELLSLGYSDIDVENRTLFVRQGKGAKDRIVPMSAALAEALREYIFRRDAVGRLCPSLFTSLHRDTAMSREGLLCLVRMTRRLASLRFTVHTFRHTFATLMLEGGCDIYSLSRLLGHTDIRTTTLYLAATASHLREQMLKHPLDSGRV